MDKNHRHEIRIIVREQHDWIEIPFLAIMLDVPRMMNGIWQKWNAARYILGQYCTSSNSAGQSICGIYVFTTMSVTE